MNWYLFRSRAVPHVTPLSLNIRVVVGPDYRLLHKYINFFVGVQYFSVAYLRLASIFSISL